MKETFISTRRINVDRVTLTSRKALREDEVAQTPQARGRGGACLPVMLSQETWSFPGSTYRRDHVGMKILNNVSRFLLGLVFLVFGLNGFLHFIPMPPPSGVAGQFLGSMFVTKYLVFAFAIQLICGVLLLVNRYVPIALTILGPIIVNILLCHSLMNPA